jgi:hypothetical protein
VQPLTSIIALRLWYRRVVQQPSAPYRQSEGTLAAYAADTDNVTVSVGEALS